MNLSTHFTLDELVRSDTAVRLGIDNTPPADVLPHLVVAANGMELVRNVLGHTVIVLSGHRCEALERVLCGKDFAAWCLRHGKPAPGEPLARVEISWREYFNRKGHPKGYCVDFICHAFGTPQEIVSVVRASGVNFDQLICEGTWVHISFAPEMRGQVLVATFNNGTPTYKEAA